MKRLFSKLIKALLLSAVLSFVLPLQLVQADNFYSSGGRVANCHVATVVGVQYNSIGGNGVSWNSSHVGGSSGNWIQSHHFTQVADITYPDAHRYPYIADKVSVPPNTQVNIGSWTYSYAGHGVNIDNFHLFTSRVNPSQGDLTRLGAGGSYGTIYMNGFPARSGKYITTGSLGYFPDRTSSYGKVIYSFNTIQPMQVQSFTATPQWSGENLSIQYDLILRNVSTYTLNNIRVKDVMPSGAVYDQTHNFSAGQTRTITYTENWGISYPSTIVNDPVTIWDNNRHTETQSAVQPNSVTFDDPAIRPGVAMRDNSTAPSSWNAGQPVWGQIERPPIIVELIPYWFNSDPVTLDVDPILFVSKVVSDVDEIEVKENSTRPNEEITYDITVRNTGGRADNVVITDDYDESLIEITDAGGGIDNGDTITWQIDELQHGESASFTINAITTSPLPHGTHHAPNIVTVDSDQTDPVDDSTQTNITAEVIMEIDKQVSDSDEEFGDSNDLQGAHPDNTERLSTYSINIQNSGDADGHHVFIHDDVSEILQYGTILNISDDGVLTTETVDENLIGEIVWDIGDLSQTESREVTFDVQFNAGITDLTEIENIAEVISDEIDPVSDTTTTTIHSPILELDKDDGIEYAEPNQSVSWAINIQNTGTGNAYNVEVYDFVPEKMTVSDISDDGVWDGDTRRIIWSTTEPHYILNGSFNPDTRSTWGDSKELSFDAQLDQVFPNGDETLVNNAVLETDYYDPIEASHELPILTPVLEIEKTQELTEVVAPSQPIIYTIEYRNIGTGSSPNTIITDTIPEHTSFVEFIETESGIEGVWDADTDLITWDLEALESNEGGTVSFKVVINIPTEGGTEILNEAIIDSPTANEVRSEVITSTVDSCCLGGFIWEDSNNNGVFDPNETGIPNVKIHISWGATEYLEGEQTDIFTDSNGHYEYTGLPYHTVLTVNVDIPDGFDEITTDHEYQLVLLPPTDDGVIQDYELDGIRYLTAGQCINFLNAGVYRDIILAQTGQSILIPLIAGLGFMTTGVLILVIRRIKRKK